MEKKLVLQAFCDVKKIKILFYKSDYRKATVRKCFSKLCTTDTVMC